MPDDNDDEAEWWQMPDTQVTKKTKRLATEYRVVKSGCWMTNKLLHVRSSIEPKKQARLIPQTQWFYVFVHINN